MYMQTYSTCSAHVNIIFADQNSLGDTGHLNQHPVCTAPALLTQGQLLADVFTRAPSMHRQ